MFPTPQNPASGIFVLEQAKALSDRGHRVSVVSPTPYIPDKVAKFLDKTPSSKLPKKDTYNGVTVHYPRYWSLPRSETLPLIAYTFRRILRKNLELFESTDLINAHVALPDGFGSVPVARKLDVPLVTTVHGADIHTSAKRYFERRQIQSVFDCSDEIIMVSNRLLKEAKEKFTGLDGTNIVYNGIPTDKIENIEENEQHHPFSNGRLVVTTVGHLIPRKGHKTVIGALRELPPDIRPYYLILGDGWFRDELETYVSENKLENYVHFAGYIPDHNTIFANLKSADIMAMPSVNEAFGVAYLEGMACGLPVIACEGEGPADFITHRETGFLIPPRDPGAVAEVIRELQEDLELRQHVASRGQKTAIYRFSWERNAESVERIFNKAIEIHD
jgi:glycosyltransferase involved in cell wall biosynthesis